MDISFEIILIFTVLLSSFVFLFLQNNSIDALYNFVYNIISTNILVSTFCIIILLIILFNIRIY